MYNTLLKIFKEAPNDFSTDDSAMHPQFEAHFLSLDKKYRFPINLPVFNEGEVTNSNIFIRYLSCPCSWIDFCKNLNFVFFCLFFSEHVKA